MKTLRPLVLAAFMFVQFAVMAQDSMQTVFKAGKGSGGYGALTNKFTTINGEYANLVGAYGGWYVNHKFLLGIGAAALTNDLPVPDEYSVNPFRKMSYEYGQVGLMTEYVFGSDKAIHLVASLFSGAGFTVQYERHGWDDDFDYDHHHGRNDENWFFVAEPGIQVEVNLFRWMRFSPGVSYRAAFGSDARGLSDSDLSNVSYNATLKFGKF